MTGNANDRCPDCGTPLPSDPATEGLCPQCLLNLALVDFERDGVRDEIPTVARGVEEMPTAAGEGPSPGKILGDRYQIREALGRGGMGEVWRAFDLKLRVDVALKALRPELVEKKEARELLRGEVRSAREVVSPNVCRIFDLEVEEGQELISMEYIDGTTLADILRRRGPLELKESREIASQFLSGLEAIHQAGLVHRDFKPENVMVTRSGRVVVMDFGVAKGLAEGKNGMIAGTPAYMAPEQARGGSVDARADVFSAGVVLAEMTGGEGDNKARKALFEAVREVPPKVPEGPWAPVLQQALSWEPESRYASARALSRALEEVVLKLPGFEEKRPYPGLASFTEDDAEYFFGRELEVESLWKKLKRPHLLALIGPSGAGKSSFLRAGLLPTLPETWKAVLCTPGNRPFQALAQTLVPFFSGDTEAIEHLLHFEERETAVSLVARWRKQHEQALVIVDQFEELFTLNPPEIQEAFAELLGRLALEADVHVILSMRDDFLFQCQAHEALSPIFSELTPLGTLSESSLRRALVQPALACGYRFEDDKLVDEMVSEVSEERGALPLLAFAASRLWEKRDYDKGLLTREAYEEIGRVAGALAHHAEATLERIGSPKIPIVRELFRNLVTAQGTRVGRKVEELLSVFPEGEERKSAGEILRALIDARLLTTYESVEDEDVAEHRVEIIHESLLSRWPRLVRWQTQDAEGAQLRDELRQAAQMWGQHDRSEDLLWTGTAFREFQLWRERYPGGLSAQEEAFAAAMSAKTTRRRRRRRLATVAVISLAVGVAAVMTSLWRRSEDETLRAEAGKLLALAQLRHEEDPTEALAFTTASLELADTEDARVFATRLLREAPPALELEQPGARLPTFTPDASRLAASGNTEEAWVWTAEGGDPPLVLPGHQPSPRAESGASWASNELLVTSDGGWPTRRCYVWRFPEGERVRTIDFGGLSFWQVGPDTLLAVTQEDVPGREVWRLRSWRLPDGDARELGRVDWSAPAFGGMNAFVPSGKGWLYAKGRSVYLRPLPAGSGRDDRLLGRHPTEVASLWPLWGDPVQVYSLDRAGEIRIWDFSQNEPKLAKVIPRQEGESQRVPDPSGRWALSSLAHAAGAIGSDGSGRQARVWDLDSWPEARPLTLRRSGSWYGAISAFHPRGDWLVISTRETNRLTFWPLRGAWPSVVDGYTNLTRPLAFSPDGRWLAASWLDSSPENVLITDTLRLWPLPGSGSREVKTLTLPERVAWSKLVFDPQGRFLFVVGNEGRVYVVPLDGSPPQRLEGFSDHTVMSNGAVSPSGRRVATAFNWGQGPKTLRLWDLETGELRLFDLPEVSSSNDLGAGGILNLAFVDESTLYTAGDGGIRRWNLESGAHELVFATKPGYTVAMALGPEGRTALVHVGQRGGAGAFGSVEILDLTTGGTRALPAFGERVHRRRFALDASGTVAATSGDPDGIVRVGHLSGGEPHLLVGHEGPVQFVAISPDRRWIASAGDDDTLRLWPMPDLSKPPLHALPLDNLIAKLKSLTNLRVVRDPESAEGWKVELDPFPGWKDIPER